jgi:hypothetical protein
LSAPFEIIRRPEVPGLETFGELFIEGVHFCFTLERPWLNDEPDVSCIPIGTYEVRYLWSDKFGKLMPHVMDVPGRSGILFHKLNWVRQSEGCIGLGERISGDMLQDSGDAYDDFLKWFASVGNEANVTISYQPTATAEAA